MAHFKKYRNLAGAVVFFLFLLCVPDLFAAGRIPKPNDVSFVNRLASTGLIGKIQLLLSICTMAFALERFIHVRKKLILPKTLLDQTDLHVQTRMFDILQELCDQTPSVLSRVISVVIKNRSSSFTEISSKAADIAGREMKQHLLRTYPLAVIAAVSPLIGLLGTVYGMVGAFDAIAQSGEMGNASLMAGSISYALLTTVFGLIIAIPALTLYHFFRIKIHLYTSSLEAFVSELIDELKETPELQNANIA